MNLKETISQIVNRSTGMKAIPLITEVNQRANAEGFQFTHDYYNAQIESLVKEKEIVEVEYVLAMVDYRIKSIYFPKGTTVRIVE